MLQALRKILVAILFGALGAPSVLAIDYSSSSFTVRDPIFSLGGEYATSDTFQYFSSTQLVTLGPTVSTSFSSNTGFLAFPAVVSPVISATAGDSQVSLSWTAANGNGLNVAEYEIGQAAVSGGPYTFSSNGLALSDIITSLTNGTTYYFVIRVNDGLGNALSTSAQVAVTPTTATSSSSGGGGGAQPAGSVVTFTGRAYGGAQVSLLSNAIKISEVTAEADGAFSISKTGLNPGEYTFLLVATDQDGNRSLLIPVTAVIGRSVAVQIAGIFLPPTIVSSSASVQPGEDITFSGYSFANSEVTLSFTQPVGKIEKTVAQADGRWSLTLSTAELANGSYIVRPQALIGTEASGYGLAHQFTISSLPISSAACGRADLNCDGAVNLVDFSIVAFWYNRPLVADTVTLESELLNNDGQIDLVDLSIMAFYWSG